MNLTPCSAEDLFAKLHADAFRDAAKRMLRRIPLRKRTAALRPLWARERDGIRDRLIDRGVSTKEAKIFAAAEVQYRQHFADLHGDDVILDAVLILWNDDAGWINFALRWRNTVH